MHSTPWLPEVVDLPRCNNANIDWNVRMPTDPCVVDHKVEMLLRQCEEEDHTLETTTTINLKGFTINLPLVQ